MARTLRQLMNKTVPTRKQSSSYVEIKAIKTKKNAQGFPMILAKTKSRATLKGAKKPGTVQTHISTVEVNKKGQVVVSCSCSDFAFMWEVALNDVGAARIEYSNGESPDEKNPSRIPGLCKHLYAFGSYLVDNGKL